MITLEAWTKNVVEILIRDYKFRKKKAKKTATDMKGFYSMGLDENTAIEEFVLDIDP